MYFGIEEKNTHAEMICHHFSHSYSHFGIIFTLIYDPHVNLDHRKYQKSIATLCEKNIFVYETIKNFTLYRILSRREQAASNNVISNTR